MDLVSGFGGVVVAGGEATNASKWFGVPYASDDDDRSNPFGRVRSTRACFAVNDPARAFSNGRRYRPTTVQAPPASRSLFAPRDGDSVNAQSGSLFHGTRYVVADPAPTSWSPFAPQSAPSMQPTRLFGAGTSSGFGAPAPPRDGSFGSMTAAAPAFVGFGSTRSEPRAKTTGQFVFGVASTKAVAPPSSTFKFGTPAELTSDGRVPVSGAETRPSFFGSGSGFSTVTPPLGTGGFAFPTPLPASSSLFGVPNLPVTSGGFRFGGEPARPSALVHTELAPVPVEAQHSALTAQPSSQVEFGSTKPIADHTILSGGCSLDYAPHLNAGMWPLAMQPSTSLGATTTLSSSLFCAAKSHGFATGPLGNTAVPAPIHSSPAGPLGEPLKAISNASVVGITTVNAGFRNHTATPNLALDTKSVQDADHQPTSAVAAGSHSSNFLRRALRKEQRSSLSTRSMAAPRAFNASSSSKQGDHVVIDRSSLASASVPRGNGNSLLFTTPLLQTHSPRLAKLSPSKGVALVEDSRDVDDDDLNDLLENYDL